MNNDNDRKLPRYVFEVQLYQRHLARTLRMAEERVNNLLNEQIALLERRRELLVDLHRAVLDQWNEEINSTSGVSALLPAPEEPSNGE